MALYQIRTLGDEGLRKKAHRVEKFDRKLANLLDDMAETMYAANGAGLAAPQIGILRRVVTIDVDERLIELVNPEIIQTEGEQIRPEGCLSVPGKRGTVNRPLKVRVRAQDRRGERFEVEGEEYLAVALCHELDHLDGVLYLDKMIEDVTDQQADEESDAE
jgi:peptide deformylase